jgi:cytochrome c-type biogenesis protein CcmH/NrfG
MNNEFDNDATNRAWLGQAKVLLDQSAQGLDAGTMSRLNRARQAALAGSRPRAARRWFLPAGLASACVLLLAVAAWHSYAPPGMLRLPALPLTASGNSNSGDIDLVSGDDSLELYQDLEFYAWLDAQDQGSDG